jgi:uncharacterized protein (DUF924 family)
MDTAFLRDIYAWWFGDPATVDDYQPEKFDFWFGEREETDRYIREHWGRLIPQAAQIEWDAPALSRTDAIALVVLFDQFSRNAFRGSGEAFAYDPKARALAGSLVDAGWRRFAVIERVFLTIPFEHSEDVADQDRGVYLSAELALTAPEPVRGFCRTFLDYTTAHRNLIRKFGRFPHRNAVLGRESTPEELAFMAEKGRGY